MSESPSPHRLIRQPSGPVSLACRYGYLNHHWLIYRDRQGRRVWSCRRCHQDVRQLRPMPALWDMTDHRGEP